MKKYLNAYPKITITIKQVKTQLLGMFVWLKNSIELFNEIQAFETDRDMI